MKASPLLQITRQSDDVFSKIGFVAGIVLLTAAAIVALVAGNLIVQIIAGSVAFILLVGVVVIAARIVFPHELEFVIDDDRIRFGVMSSPEKQKVILRQDVRCLIYDPVEDELNLDIGKWIAARLAPQILVDGSRIRNVVDCVRENWPDVPVVSREQFQRLCRSK